MKTLLLSALGAALVSASFLAGATWVASGEGAMAREVTVHSGATAITLPAAILAAAPGMAVASQADMQAPLRHVRLVLSSDAKK